MGLEIKQLTRLQIIRYCEKLEDRVKFLEEENNNLKNELMEDMKYETKLEQENKKLKEERDFFKEQAILWRKDYKNEYEKNRKLEEKIEELEDICEGYEIENNIETMGNPIDPKILE